MSTSDPKAGDRFGKLTVIDPERRGRTVLCRCDCGTEKYIRVFNLVRDRAKSCGCWRQERLQGTKFPDLAPHNDAIVTIGSRHGRWTVIAEPRTGHNRIVACRCECGNEKDNVVVKHLLSGESKSCGCLKSDGTRAMHEKVATPWAG